MDIKPNDEKVVMEAEKVITSKEKDRQYQKLLASISSGFFGLLLIVYIVCSLSLGSFRAPSDRNAWAVLWPIVLLADLPSSILRAIHKRRFCEFSIWSVALFVYLILGMCFDLWHPYWAILLSIPAYYCLFGPIDKYIKYREKN